MRKRNALIRQVGLGSADFYEDERNRIKKLSQISIVGGAVGGLAGGYLGWQRNKTYFWAALWGGVLYFAGEYIASMIGQAIFPKTKPYTFASTDSATAQTTTPDTTKKPEPTKPPDTTTQKPDKDKQPETDDDSSLSPGQIRT